jgi:hypothetical protein
MKLRFTTNVSTKSGYGRYPYTDSISNRPSSIFNRFVPGSGVGATSIFARRAKASQSAPKRVIPQPPPPSLIISLNKTTEDGLTVGNSVDKDMRNRDYTYSFDPNSYPEFFSGMAPFVQSNIITKPEDDENNIYATIWRDWDDDIFDSWGYFYIYDVDTGKYYFPLINPLNQDDGIFATQTFNVFGRTFTIKHGWCVQGIFKFDISVNDNKPFRFGAYGDMGSDGDEVIQYLTHPYSLGSSNLTLYYFKNQEDDDDTEIFYAYFIPKNIQQNSAQTYVHVNDGEDMSLKSNEITQGLLVYFSKTNDVKDWVIHDLGV